jgi:hypothetical protein
MGGRYGWGGRKRRRAWVTEAGSRGAGVVVQANTACPRGPGLLAPRATGCRRTDSPLGGYRYSAFPDRGVDTTLTAGPDTCLPRMFGAALAGSIEEEKLRPMSAGGHVVKAVQGTTRTCVCLVVNNDHFLCARRPWQGSLQHRISRQPKTTEVTKDFCRNEAAKWPFLPTALYTAHRSSFAYSL